MRITPEQAKTLHLLTAYQEHHAWIFVYQTDNDMLRLVMVNANRIYSINPAGQCKIVYPEHPEAKYVYPVGF